MGDADLTRAAFAILGRIITADGPLDVRELLKVEPTVDIDGLIDALQELLDSGLVVRVTSNDAYLYKITIAGYKFVFGHLNRSWRTHVLWSCG